MSEPVIENVLRKNPYALLQGKNTYIGNSSSKPAKSVENLQINLNIPPPIIIQNLEIISLKEILKSFSHYNDTTFKHTTNGTKLFVQCTEQYKLLKSFCIENQLKFHSHLLKEEQKIKIVIHGLHEMEINDLKDELELKEVFPCDIKKLQIFKPRFDKQCIYMLYFMKSDGIKISNLRTIRSLCHMMVKWDFYHPRKTGPTQCNNCMQFGHGAESCFLDPKCIRCGDNHKSSSCSLLSDPSDIKSRIPEDKVKCANCGEKHTANFNKCKKRVEYIQFKNSIRTKNTNISKPNNYKFQTAPQLNNFDFPNISNVKKSSQPAAWRLKNLQNNMTSNNIRDQVNSDHINELMSAEELMTAFRELMQKLQTAKTRYDQITALGEVAIKYASNVSP